jgi:shikimate dehydrogenase
MTTPTSVSVRVNGATRVFGIVGDPIVQARSPEVYCERFAAAGLNAVMVPLQVSDQDFAAVMPGLMRIGNLDGLLITAPHKARMTALADRLGPTAACIGAVNALRREADGSWSADMFDGEGFAQGVLAKGERLQGRHVLLFGAGGAGSAIACALAGHGAASIRIVNPDAERTTALVAALGAAFPACDIAAATDRRTGFDMVVNASTVGMRPGDGLPGDIGVLTPDMLVGDVVVCAEPTAIIAQAQAAGCRWFNGHDMHSGQISALMQFLAPADGGSGPGAQAF